MHVLLQITADDVKSYENAKLLARDSRKSGKSSSSCIVDQGLCGTRNLVSAGKNLMFFKGTTDTTIWIHDSAYTCMRCPPPAAHGRLTPPLSGSSVRERSSSTGPSARLRDLTTEQARNLFNINTSELQLEEETEKDEGNEGETPLRAEEHWRIDAIGVKGFKLLEMLRAMRNNSDDLLSTVRASA